jgi:hypothetical protein
MSNKPSILIQLDTDVQPSVFDRVVAVDAGADHIFSYAQVTPDQVPALVHGAIFTRSPRSLHRTAIFIGGSDLDAGERLFAEVGKHLLPKLGLQVSLMLDSNGANTTAVAAVRAAAKHLKLTKSRALVLGGTGPVGRRVARLLAWQGAEVRIGSRSLERADAVCRSIRDKIENAIVQPVSTARSADAEPAVQGCSLIVAAGAAGTVLLPRSVRERCQSLKVAIDLNAVPPTGIEGIEPHEAATTHDGVICYGALGVGADKMKAHKLALAALFQRNDLQLDAEEIFELAEAAQAAP